MEQNMLLIAGAVIVVVAAIAIFALMPSTTPSAAGSASQQNGASGTGAGSTSSGSGNSAGSTSGQGSSGSGITQANTQVPTCGAGNTCISQSELASLVGSGAYNAIYTNDQGALNTMLGTGTANASFMAGNVTALWVVGYNKTGANYYQNMAVLETVYASPVAQALYAKELAATTSFGSYNVTNATMNGLTYSYEGASGIINGTSLLGYKNGKMVYLVVIGKYIPESQLAGAVAGDLP